MTQYDQGDRDDNHQYRHCAVFAAEKGLGAFLYRRRDLLHPGRPCILRQHIIALVKRKYQTDHSGRHSRGDRRIHINH